jgi:hypothetical protein
MRNIVLCLAVLVSFLTATEASAACCRYGCCDCSCVVASKMRKLAPKLDKHVKGGLQSLAVDTAASKGKNASWKCQMQAQVAMCKKQY